MEITGVLLVGGCLIVGYGLAWFVFKEAITEWVNGILEPVDAWANKVK